MLRQPSGTASLKYCSVLPVRTSQMLCRKSGAKLGNLNLNRPYVVSYHISSSHCFAPDFRHSIFKVLLGASCTYFSLEWEAQRGMCRRSTSTFKNPCGCAALDMPEWRGMADQIDWRAKQPSQVACFSEDLKCWEAWDTTCRHKAKDLIPSTAWRREALKEEALDDLPWKDERGPSSIRRTLELF